MQPAVGQAAFHVLDQRAEGGGVGEVGLDVALTRLGPAAFFREGLAGYGEDAPTLGLETLDGSMPRLAPVSSMMGRLVPMGSKYSVGSTHALCASPARRPPAA
jgi:hypothetical protein